MKNVNLLFESIKNFENQYGIKLNIENETNIEQELEENKCACVHGKIDVSNDVMYKLGILYSNVINIYFHAELDSNDSINIYCEAVVYDVFLNRDNVYVAVYNIEENTWSEFEFDPNSF